jgi:hypothetical protein
MPIVSQQQLDYVAPHTGRRRPFWHRVTIAVGLFGLFVAATPKAVGLAWRSAGGGHGTYFWFLILFPYPIWATRIFSHDLSGFVTTLMYLQLPIYGLFIGGAAFVGRRCLLIVIGSMIGLHAAAVALEYIVGV